MTIIAYNNRSACECCEPNPRDEGPRLSCADADRFGFARKPAVANIDIVVACGEKRAGTVSQRDIASADCVVSKRMEPGRCIGAAGGVAVQRLKTDGRVSGTECKAKKGLLTLSSVFVG